jgi:hypothetical protein
MSKAAYHSIHTDYRSIPGDKHYPSCLVLAPDGATISCPVVFTDE